MTNGRLEPQIEPAGCGASQLSREYCNWKKITNFSLQKSADDITDQKCKTIIFAISAFN